MGRGIGYPYPNSTCRLMSAKCQLALGGARRYNAIIGVLDRGNDLTRKRRRLPAGAGQGADLASLEPDGDDLSFLSGSAQMPSEARRFLKHHRR
jgi:hypothetical protein